MKEKVNRVCYSKVDDKEDMTIFGSRDTSHKYDKKVINGVLLFLTNRQMDRASPLYWNQAGVSFLKGKRDSDSFPDDGRCSVCCQTDKDLAVCEQLKEAPCKIVHIFRVNLGVSSIMRQVERKSLCMTV